MELLQMLVQRSFPALLLSLVCLLLVPPPSLPAQELDSKGKEFWVTFMPNLGSEAQEESELKLYLSATRPTTVSITYMGDGRARQVALPTANTPVEVDIRSLFNLNAELDDVLFGTDEISRKSLLVNAADEITLYGVNIRSKSADAFLSLPVDVLTGRYVVLAYPNGFDVVGQQAYDTPSQFAVIATQDATTLRVTAPPATNINGRAQGGTFTVRLDKGEVFLGQARFKPSQEQDVSGTELLADKPIAVYSGTKRTSIPTSVGNYRDHLVEQLPPLDAWGRGALVTPFFKVSPQSNFSAVVRVLAAFPGTDVSVTRATGVQNFSLGPGASMELPLLEAMSIKATLPILVAQYEHSVGETDLVGDPFMMLSVPTEQFDTAYAFQSIQHSEFTNNHYINVVIPAGAQGSLRLDNNPITNSFQPVPGSAYVYAQIKVKGGAHYIRSDSAFGLYVYGYGVANSYGYPGGMLFKKLVIDFQPPEISWLEDCAQLHGMVVDDKITDSGLDSVYATSESKNVVVTVPPFERGADSVSYGVRLDDPYQDGEVNVRGVDRSGLARTQSNSIPGYTLRVASIPDVPARLEPWISVNNPTFCREIQIVNYGKFEQEIRSASLLENVPQARITTPFPMKIAPGTVGIINICFQDLADTVFDLTLDIDGPCIDRRVAMVQVDHRIDTLPPGVEMDGPPCGDDFLLSYQEALRSSGIVSIHYDTLINCSAEMLSDTTMMPAQSLQVRLRRHDPRRDIIYAITLRDAAGNTLTDRDTIGGFTVAMFDNAASTDTLGAHFSREWNGDSLRLSRRLCDSVLLTNYGHRPVTIDRVVLKGNLSYSVPPSQFPMIVQPGESVPLSVCIEGWDTGLAFDTMMIFDGCEHLDELMMVTPVLALNGLGSDICNNALGISTFAPAKRNYLTTPIPNPAGAAVSVDVALAERDIVNLEIFDASGNPAFPVLRGIEMSAGISRVSFDVSKLDNGAYFCRMQTARGEVFVEKLVVTR